MTGFLYLIQCFPPFPGKVLPRLKRKARALVSMHGRKSEENAIAPEQFGVEAGNGAEPSDDEEPADFVFRIISPESKMSQLSHIKLHIFFRIISPES